MTQQMKALIQLHDGYSGTQTGPDITDMSPFLEHGTVAVPTLEKGKALIKVHLAAVNHPTFISSKANTDSRVSKVYLQDLKAWARLLRAIPHWLANG